MVASIGGGDMPVVVSIVPAWRSCCSALALALGWHLVGYDGVLEMDEINDDLAATSMVLVMGASRPVKPTGPGPTGTSRTCRRRRRGRPRRGPAGARCRP